MMAGVVALVAAAGCSGDGSGSESTSGSGSVDSIMLRAMCEFDQRCRPFDFLQFGDVEHCVQRLRLFGDLPFHSPGMRITKDQANACADAMRAARCDEKTELENGGVCMFRGTVENGKACLWEYQCASGYCTRRGDFECGVCATPAVEGEVCEDGECLRNTSCREYQDSPPICYKYDVQLGETCNPKPPDYIYCEIGARCVEHVCVALARVGEECEWSDDCDGLSYCDQPSYSEKGVCRAVVMRGVGEDCDYDENYCGPRLYCDENEKCKAYVADGAVCDYENDECMEPFVCAPDGASSGTSRCQNVTKFVAKCE